MRKFFIVFILATAICLAATLPVLADPTVNSFEIMGTISADYPTVQIATSDTASDLKTLINTAWGRSDAKWTKVKAIWITVETNDMRVAFGTSASQSGSGVGHRISSTSSLRLPINAIGTISVINAVNGSNAILQVSVEF